MEKFKVVVKYYIVGIIFLILLRVRTLTRLDYCIFLFFVIANQSLAYIEDRKFRWTGLLALEMFSIFYLSKNSFYIFFLGSYLLLVDILNYSNKLARLYLLASYSIIGAYMLYRNFSLINVLAFVLVIMFSIWTGFLEGKFRELLALREKITDLEYQESVRQLEDEEKSLALREMYLTKERNRISRDIHDSVGHSLSTIIIQLSAIEQLAKVDGEKAALLSKNLREFSVKSMDEIRGVLKDTKPEGVLENELIMMIENLVEETMTLTKMDIVFKFSANRYLLDYEKEKLLYNGVKEFISNTIKHSGGNKINIILFYKEDELILSMKDNGRGSNKIKKGMGLKALEERVRENNGSLEISSDRDQGFFTRIRLERKV